MDIFALVHALGLDSFLPIVTAVVAVAAALAAVLPHPAPGSPWTIPRNLLDLLAVNVGKAKNATPPGVSGDTAGAGAAVLVLALALGLSACAGQTADQRAASTAAIGSGLVCVLHAAGNVSAIAAGNDTDVGKAVAAGAVVMADKACQDAVMSGVVAVTPAAKP